VKFAIVSDVHGRMEGLAEAGRGADVFVCLGDLILFLDYDEPGNGIFADLHGEAMARQYIALRTANRWREARDLSQRLWSSLGENTWDVISREVGRQYRAIFAAMPPGLLTYGNVDVPALWPDLVQPHHRILDGEAVEVGGLRLGFVGGGLPSPMRTPFEVPEEEFDAKIEAVGPVDVLFSHIPPALPELTFDTAARRFERGSAGLLRAVQRWQPRYLFHGHVHNPLVPRTRIGRTEIVNVGHFRSRRRPLLVDVPAAAAGE
jgi:Icc-related predicted phosphoesterase